jgi:hypothetical protein
VPDTEAECNARSHTRRILQENVRLEEKIHEEIQGSELVPSQLDILVLKLWWGKEGEELAD